MMERNSIWSSSSTTFVLCCVLFSNIFLCPTLAGEEHFRPPVLSEHLVPRESRRTVASSEFGTITAVDVNDKEKGPYHLQFITLDAGSLFLPVLLHADMVFYVHTGSGTVTWVSEDKSNSIEVERGDVYRIGEGNVFYVQSHSNATREKLRIHAIFNTITDESPMEGFVGPYSNISDLVRGFSDKVLQMGFGVSEDITKGIKWVERPPPIVQFQPKNETDEESNWKEGILEALVGRKYSSSLNKGKKSKKKKTKTFNLYKRKPDVENCNGWSIAVSNRDFKPLMDSDIGVFIVNLTRGAMMGPHWNPRATEFAIVIHGEGMVQFVCPSISGGKMSSEQFKCQNETFKVKKEDLFVVPRFHPMAQIAFNNDSFVFMGFTTSVSRNHPQYLAGKMSVLRVIDREVLARSFNTANTSTLDRFLDSQEESIILDCTSCAEELERKVEEEIKRRREEEEAKKREEEEARRREEEEEEAKRREEEARKKQEEEEEARRKEEEEARREEEEEEEAREEARRREEEARRKQEEEEARRREEEEEEEARRRQEEEEAEEARKREEEEEEEERARTREEEEEEREREEEEAIRREQAAAAAAAAS